MYVCIVCITMCSLVICINCNLCYITLFNTITLHYAWLWQLLECSLFNTITLHYAWLWKLLEC